MTETATTKQPSDEEILNSLKTVIDPELGVNIIDMGLVYRIDLDDDGKAQLFMTLTSPGCPAGPQIKGDVIEALSSVEGVTDVRIQFVFNPPWSPAMMTPEGKEELGIMDEEDD